MINDNNTKVSEFLKEKEVVVDTSVLLDFSPSMLQEFSNCVFVIPAVVIRELEEKRSHSTLGYSARAWLHLIEDTLISDGKDNLEKGVLIPETDNVYLSIEMNHKNQSTLPLPLQDGSNDSTILAVLKNRSEDEKAKSADERKDVVLLSRDLPMRINAKLHLEKDAYDLSTEVRPFDGVYHVNLSDVEVNMSYDEDASGVVSTEFQTVVLSKLPEGAASSALIVINQNKAMTYLMVNGKILKNLSSEAYRIKASNNSINIVPRSIEQKALAEYINESSENLPVVSVGGNAGGGKTMIALAASIAQVKNTNTPYRKVLVFRSLHEMGQGQEMGFLPGTIEDKMAPWAGAIDDALESIATISNESKNKSISKENIEKAKEKLYECIEVQPITYLRGRSISNAILIIEEAQNFSSSELLHILSRAGKDSKIILTFDAAQVDNKYLRSGQNADVWKLIDQLKDKGVAAHITLKKTERSKIAEVASAILEK